MLRGVGLVKAFNTVNCSSGVSGMSGLWNGVRIVEQGTRRFSYSALQRAMQQPVSQSASVNVLAVRSVTGTVPRCNNDMFMLVRRMSSQNEPQSQTKEMNKEVKLSNGSKGSNDEYANHNAFYRFWKYWTAPVDLGERYSAGWWWEMFVICVVFAITGSSTMFFARPLMKDGLKLEGTLKDGPWSYRISYFVLLMPIYSVVLVLTGTAFGRHDYFKKFAVKMWSRFIPKSMQERLLK